MKNLYYLTLLILLFGACQSGKKIPVMEGDLYFKMIDLQGGFYKAPKSMLDNVTEYARKTNRDTLNEQGKKEYDHIKLLMDQDLLGTPHIWLKGKDGKKRLLFVSETDYQKIKRYDRSELVEKNKKVVIQAEYQALALNQDTVYKCVKLLSVDKRNGKTEWNK